MWIPHKTRRRDGEFEKQSRRLARSPIHRLGRSNSCWPVYLVDVLGQLRRRSRIRLRLQQNERNYPGVGQERLGCRTPVGGRHPQNRPTPQTGASRCKRSDPEYQARKIQSERFDDLHCGARTARRTR